MTETRRASAFGSIPVGPFSDLQWPAPWMAFGATAGAIEPLMRNAARINLELSSLAGQRAQAYSRIPEALSRCRTPFDLMQAQMAFWQEAGRQYAATGEQIGRAWQSILPMKFGAAGADEASDARDFITFPEEKEDAASEQRRRPGDGRRAA